MPKFKNRPEQEHERDYGWWLLVNGACLKYSMVTEKV
jgi:hypothetical protein